MPDRSISSAHAGGARASPDNRKLEDEYKTTHTDLTVSGFFFCSLFLSIKVPAPFESKYTITVASIHTDPKTWLLFDYFSPCYALR
jgi:hypothetical protein